MIGFNQDETIERNRQNYAKLEVDDSPSWELMRPGFWNEPIE